MKTSCSPIRNVLLAAVVVPGALKAASVIQFDSPTAEVKEFLGGQVVTATGLALILKCSPAPAQSLRVTVKAMGGTAQCPADYFPCELVFDFQPGFSRVGAWVSVVDDHLPESDETVVFGIAEIEGDGVAGPVSKTTLTILTPTVMYVQPYYGESGPNYGEANSYAFYVTRQSEANSGAVSFDYATTSNGTARPNIDFVPVRGRLTLAPGETSKAIVTVLNNADVETVGPGKWIDLALSNPSGGVTLARTTAQAWLTDDEIPATIDLSFAPQLGRSSSLAITSVAVQPDGMVLVAGRDLYRSRREVALLRLKPDGSVDDSFEPAVPADVTLSKVIVVPDAKILVSGSSLNTNFFLRRLLPGGEIDSTFAPVPGESGSPLVQADEKIVLWYSKSLRRLYSDGSADTMFDENAAAFISGLGAEIYQAILQPSSGKLLLLTGNSLTGNSVVIRLNLDGSRDSLFTPVKGEVSRSGSPSEPIFVQSDGRFFIILFGAGEYRLVRFNPDGTPDDSFRGPALPDGWKSGGWPVAEVDGRIYYQNGGQFKQFFRSDVDGVIDPSFVVRFREHTLDVTPLLQLRAVSHPGSLLSWSSSPVAANRVVRSLARILLERAPATGFIFEGHGSSTPWFRRTREDEGAFSGLISRTGNTSNTINVRYATRDGTARAGQHYIVTEGTLTFAPFEVEKTITVPLIQDNVFRGRPHFFIELSEPSAWAALDIPLRVDIYDREPGIVMGSVWHGRDGSAALQMDITGQDLIHPFFSWGFGEDGRQSWSGRFGQEALYPNVLEQSYDMKSWAATPSDLIQVEFSESVFFRVPSGEGHGFFRLRRK
ncbi:MAG: hypothetical protein L0Z50_43005 [Verrucomicrobiales bacterium]|nr:hypothetical protein [Verrucomicrobiales bacterium]